MLILASNSPRRRQLLTLAGWTYQTAPADIDESPLLGEDPCQYVLRLAREKALVSAAAWRWAPGEVSFVVAADTTVALEGEILAKPADPSEATQMLLRLRNRTHQVYTGLALLRCSDQALCLDLCATDVHMRAYSRSELDAYVQSGDPLDKAGAYAIQHAGFHPVDGLVGCYANVTGLPVCRLAALMQAWGRQAADRPAQVACAGEPGMACAFSSFFDSIQSSNEGGVR